MTKIIAIANHKGGVGKTTSVASIGACLSEMGYRVLLVDLDAQANLTGSLLKGESERTIYNALKERKDLPTISIRENLWLTPSSLNLAGIELELASAVEREFILKDLLEPISGSYDFILLDCPPSLGLITLNSFVAADEVYIPLTAEVLPYKGVAMILDIMAMAQKRLNPSLKLSGIIISRWENSKLSRDVETAIREKFGDVVFSTKIRKNIAVAEAPIAKKDILSYNPSCNGAKDFRELTQEILKKYEKQ